MASTIARKLSSLVRRASSTCFRSSISVSMLHQRTIRPSASRKAWPRTRLESFLRMMGSVKVQSVVHCQRDLVGNEREKADFLLAIGIGFYTAHSEAAESPLHCRQRKRAYRTNSAFLEHRGYCWETSLPV